MLPCKRGRIFWQEFLQPCFHVTHLAASLLRMKLSSKTVWKQGEITICCIFCELCYVHLEVGSLTKELPFENICELGTKTIHMGRGQH